MRLAYFFTGYDYGITQKYCLCDNLSVNDFVAGSVIQIHGDIAIEGELEVVPSSEDIKEIETKMCDLLTNFSSLTIRQKYIAGKKLEKLSKELTHLIAAYPTGSIVVYFLCETFQSVVVFKSMLDNDYLRSLLEKIFNCVWESKNQTRLRLSLSLDPNVYQKSIEEARRTSETCVN